MEAVVARLHAVPQPPKEDAPEHVSKHVGLAFYYSGTPSEIEYTVEEVFVRNVYDRPGVHIPDGGVVFDVGANQGVFSVYASALAADVKVYSFEPIPEVHETMQRNRARYGVQGKAFLAGLSALPGTAEFTYYPGLSVLSGQYADATKDRDTFLQYDRFVHPSRDEADRSEMSQEYMDGETVVCQLRTCSDVLAEVGAREIHLLKVDVERAELDVLRGLDAEDWPRVHHVVVECQGKERREEVLDLIRARGHVVVHVEDDPACADMCLIHAARSDVAAKS